MKKLACFAVLLTCSSVASELTIDISNDAFRTEFVSTELGNNSEIAIAVIATDNDVNVYSAKGLVAGNVDNIKNLEASMGVKGYFIDLKDDNVQGFGLGGEISYAFPANPRAQFEAHLYYAPGITVSDDVDYLTDISIRASYRLLKNGEVYLGYRNLRANQKSAPDVELNQGLNVGFKFLF